MLKFYYALNLLMTILAAREKEPRNGGAMKTNLIKFLVGAPRPWPTGAERIETMWNAVKWYVASLPGLDATVHADGSVRVFRG